MKKLFKAIAILTSFSVLTRALGFLFRIFLSRLIGAEGLGIYQIAFSVFMVLETFISSGLPLVVSKTTSSFSTKNDNKKVFSIVTSALIIGILTAIMLFSVVLIFKNLFSKLFTDERCLYILITLLPALVFSSVYATLRGYLWGHKKYFLVSFTEFIEQLSRVIVSIIMACFFYRAIDGALIASYSFIISCVISSILVVFIYFKQKGRFANPKGNFKTILKSSVPITTVKVMSSLLTPIISIIIPLQLVSVGFTNEKALEIFGIAMGMTFPLLYIPSTIIGSLSMTLIPDLSASVSTQNYKDIISRIDFSVKFSFFISFLFIPVFYALGEPIGIFLYNNFESGMFLSSSCLLIIPICLSGVTVSCLNALNLEVKSFIHYIFGSLFLIASIFILTKYMGILSLVVGLGLCLGIASILNLRMLSKKLNHNFFNLSYLFRCFLCTVPAVLMSKWLYSILKNFMPLFFSLGFSCVVCEIFFLVLGLVFNLFNLSFIKFKNIKETFKRNSQQKKMSSK